MTVKMFVLSCGSVSSGVRLPTQGGLLYKSVCSTAPRIGSRKEAPMKVFVSWSGSRSKAIATALSGWLPLVIQSVEPMG